MLNFLPSQQAINYRVLALLETLSAPNTQHLFIKIRFQFETGQHNTVELDSESVCDWNRADVPSSNTLINTLVTKFLLMRMQGDQLKATLIRTTAENGFYIRRKTHR
jgi:hypothetical protein